MDSTIGIIKKVGNKWILYSHKGKRLFESTDKSAVIKREREINFFKHKSKGRRGMNIDEAARHKWEPMKSGRKKSMLKRKNSY